MDECFGILAFDVVSSALLNGEPFRALQVSTWISTHPAGALGEVLGLPCLRIVRMNSDCLGLHPLKVAPSPLSFGFHFVALAEAEDDKAPNRKAGALGREYSIPPFRKSG